MKIITENLSLGRVVYVFFSVYLCSFKSYLFIQCKSTEALFSGVILVGSLLNSVALYCRNRGV